MHQVDLSYYRYRAEIETERAAKASVPQAVATHYRMASLYFERVERAERSEAMSSG